MDARDFSAMTGGSQPPVVSFEAHDGPYCSKCDVIVFQHVVVINDQEERCPICNTVLVWELTLPTMKEVCPLCEGEGKHVNPSIDAHGITADEFAEDPDFRDDYTSGTYDVTCNECHGLRVVDVPDFERMTKFLVTYYQQQCEEIASMYLEMESERRLGA